MATYRVSGTVDLDVSWKADVEVRLIAMNDDYDIEIDGSGVFGRERVLRDGDTVLYTIFDTEVEADSEEEAEDLVLKGLGDVYNWSIMSEIGGREEIVSVTIDNVDVSVDDVELVVEGKRRELNRL